MNDLTSRGMRVAGVAVLASMMSLSSGCALLNQMLGGGGGGGQASPPTVTTSPMRLVRAPGLKQLGAYYCPTIITDTLARLGCQVALGPQPPQASLQFEFGTTINVHNPNNIPVPALDVLLAMKIFQGQGAESLGSTCVSLCGQQDPTCTGQPKPGACSSNQNTVRTVNDFVGAVPGLIAGLASGQAMNELRKSTILAGGDISLSLTFGLGIEQALRIIQNVMPAVVQSQLQRGNPQLEIPVSGEGTVFVQLPLVGRLGVGFGPLQSSWKVL